MDWFEIFTLLILVGAPTWWYTNEALKKGRNFIISLILSFIFICSVWIGFFGWGMLVVWLFKVGESYGIKWFVGFPLYFLVGGIGVVVMTLFVSFFGALNDNYIEKGIIKVNTKLPKFIKRFFKKK